MMHVRIQPQSNEHITIQKQRHQSSSIWRTISAVIGCLPWEMTKPFRLEAFRRRLFVLSPASKRLNKRLTAALILQSSALARDLSTAYNSGSRFTVNLINLNGSSG